MRALDEGFARQRAGTLTASLSVERRNPCMSFQQTAPLEIRRMGASVRHDFSKNQGRTWGNTVIVTNVQDMYYWDQRPNVLADGNPSSIIFGRWTGKEAVFKHPFQNQLDGGGLGANLSTPNLRPTGIPLHFLTAVFLRSISTEAKPVITVRCYPVTGSARSR